HGNEAVLADDLSAAMAAWARRGPGAGLGALAGAAPALFERGHLDFRADAEDRVLEVDLEIVADILAALRAIAPALASAAEQIPEPEKVAQNVRKIGERIGIETAAGCRAQPLMTEAIIGGTLLRIAQHAVRLGGLFEGFFGVFVVRIAVR